MTQARGTKEVEQSFDAHDEGMVSMVVLRVLLLACLCAFFIVAYVRPTDRSLAAFAPSQHAAPVLVEHAMGLATGPGGSARFNGSHRQSLADVVPTKGQFSVDNHRVLERGHGAFGLDASEPIRLVRLSDGRAGLRDDHTDFGAKVHGFEVGNEVATDRLLEE